MNKSNSVFAVCLLGVATSFHASASELDVDVLFVVEPAVYANGHSREEVGKLILSQVENANEVHALYHTGVNYRPVAVLDWSDNSVSEKLEQGDSLSVAAANILSSVRYDEDGFYDNADFAMTDYQPLIHDTFAAYHADKVVFIASQGSSNPVNADIWATAAENYGVVASINGIEADNYLLAHEWGHNIGLGHPSSESCNGFFSVMCEGSHSAVDGFSASELETINGIVNNDPAFYVSRFDSNFYLGRYATELPKEASVVVSVVDNPISNDIEQTEIQIDLVDAEGNPKPFGEDISLELFTDGNETNYDDGVYQRVIFSAGETSKRVDLNVTHGNVSSIVEIGTRYGGKLADSNVVSVTIEPVEPAPAKPDDSASSSGSSGGAVGWLSLLLLPCVWTRRRNRS